MPIISIYGDLSQSYLTSDGILDNLKDKVLDIEELGLKQKDIHASRQQITVMRFRPENDMGTDIIVFVDGLFEKPECTEEVRHHLAEVIGEFIKGKFMIPPLVEVFVRTFNPTSGFWSSVD